MGLIAVKKANCKNCYRCLKSCAVKAIRYKDDKVDIMDELCIRCGKCILACQQGAKSLTNDTGAVRRLAENRGIRLAASVAPSFVGAYGPLAPKIPAALRALGFSIVEETSLGARLVSEEYAALLEDGRMQNILTTCCPSANELVRKYYPELTPLLAPVLSPMQAHAKRMRAELGGDVRAVFIGPCVSKLGEAEESEWLEGALTFVQLDEWLAEKGIDLASLPDQPFDRPSGHSRIYPVERGILRDVARRAKADGKYEFLSVSGLSNLRELFSELAAGELTRSFIEINACQGGCVGGPMMPEKSLPPFRACRQVGSYAAAAPAEGPDEPRPALSHPFRAAPIESDIPGADTIRAILAQIGKPTADKELNCGSCGYPTCREKAIAVYQGKAELYMCMPYMNDLSQAFSKVVLDVTPNYIVVADAELKIKEINRAASALFQVRREDAAKRYLFDFLDPADFQKVLLEKKSIYNKKTAYSQYGIVADETIIYVPEQNIAIGVMTDITDGEAAAEKLYKMRLESVEMAQKVINKQMVVAQEIASLLGETTAETKVTLNRLKDLILEDR